MSSYDYGEIAQQAYTEAQQQAEAFHAEYNRRQAVWQTIVDSGPGVVAYVCDWARNEQGFLEDQLRLWFYAGSSVTVEVQGYNIELCLDGTVTLKKVPKAPGMPTPPKPPGFPSAPPGFASGGFPFPAPPQVGGSGFPPFPPGAHQPTGFPPPLPQSPPPVPWTLPSKDVYDGLPELSENAHHEFMTAVIDALVADLYAKVHGS